LEITPEDSTTKVSKPYKYYQSPKDNNSKKTIHISLTELIHEQNNSMKTHLWMKSEKTCQNNTKIKNPKFFFGSQIAKINMTNTSQILKFPIFSMQANNKVKYDIYFKNIQIPIFFSMEAK
jgi:hypothetical protein